MYKRTILIIFLSLSLFSLVACNKNDLNRNSKELNNTENSDNQENSDEEDIIPYEITNEYNEKLTFRDKRSDDLQEAIDYAIEDLEELNLSKQATIDRLYSVHEFTSDTAKNAIDSIDWDYKENAYKIALYIEETNNESLTSLREALIGIFKFTKSESDYAVQKMKDNDPMENGVNRDFNSAKRFLEEISKHQHKSRKEFENILFSNLLFSREATNYALEEVDIEYDNNAYETFKNLKKEFKNKDDEDLKNKLKNEFLFTKEEVEFAFNKYMADIGQ